MSQHNMLIPGYTPSPGNPIYDQQPAAAPFNGTSDLAASLRSNAEQPQQKPKFNFGQFLASWAGNLGDSLTGNPAYANAMQGQQQADAGEAKRQRDMAEWVAKQEYEAANRPPEKPHYWEDNSGNLMSLNEQGPQVAYQDPNPWKMVPNGMGGVVPVNIQELMRGSQQGGTATGPNGEKIKLNPQTGQWEPMGGPAPQAPGGFPGY